MSVRLLMLFFYDEVWSIIVLGEWLMKVHIAKLKFIENSPVA